ncbi:MAG: D-alanine--D-alanine ligase [Candidatus Hydrogenedentes bacterium]|nr:D-alanine--D-alanine ligase [Candidatus Hydrogenedentota bacterium]
MADKKHVVVLMGGMSSEHDVSVVSGRGVANALDRTKYEVTPVLISRENRWSFGEEAPLPVFEAIARLGALQPDCVFLTLHGEYGEDGRIQGLLDWLGLPYTGTGCAASGLTMDKIRSKVVVSSQGIRVAGHIALTRATWEADAQAILSAVDKDLGFPCVVKPSELGSSVGIEIVRNLVDLQDGIDKVLHAADDIMIEEFISGREVTCGVLEQERGGVLRPLPITEIRPKEGTFFDYHCKYTPGATEEITPADLDPHIADQVMEIAAHVHEVLECRLWSRSDFIIDEKGPVWLEVNTIPGLTPTSLYPQAAAAIGIGYSELMGIFVDATMREFSQRKGA